MLALQTCEDFTLRNSMTLLFGAIFNTEKNLTSCSQLFYGKI